MIVLADLRMRIEMRMCCLLSHSFNNNLLRAYGEAGTVLGIWSIAVNKANEIPALV